MGGFDNKDIIDYNPEKNYVIVPKNGREYGKVRDILRYKADRYLEMLNSGNKMFTPSNLQEREEKFFPFASRATDMEGIAETMKDRGSFYPSIHLAYT